MLDSVTVGGVTYQVQFKKPRADRESVIAVIDGLVWVRFLPHAMERMCQRNWSIEDVLTVLLSYPEEHWKDWGVVAVYMPPLPPHRRMPEARVITVLEQRAVKQVDRCVAIQCRKNAKK